MGQGNCPGRTLTEVDKYRHIKSIFTAGDITSGCKCCFRSNGDRS